MEFTNKMLSRFTGQLRRWDINTAVIFSLLAQAWSLLAAPATMLVVARHLTAEEQGYYYTFSSVLGLQVFVELGLLTVIIQVASHEWSRLSLENGAIVGERTAFDRLSSLLRFSLQWYGAASICLCVALIFGGTEFFSISGNVSIEWKTPWMLLCVATAIGLITAPVVALIEGCNQVSAVVGLRFVQGIVGSLSVIISILLDAGLYALPIAAIARVAVTVLFLVTRYRLFVLQLLGATPVSVIDWKQEVWPFQWRIAVSWISGYFIINLFTPILFLYHGPVLAGQWGMSWAIVLAVETVAYSWLNTRVPLFGQLIARSEYKELNELFRRLMIRAIAVAGICSAAALGAVVTLRYMDIPIALRLLPVLPFAMLLAQRVANVAISGMSYYLRAHKREPMMVPSICTAVLVGASTWLLGARLGALGAAGGYLVVTLCWALPSCIYVYRTSKRLWQQSAS